jgi:hypothetical protein
MTATAGFELERGFRRSLPLALARWPVFRIAHTSAALEALVEAALEPAGLDRRSFAALLVLADLGPLKQSALAQRLGVDRTTIVSSRVSSRRKGSSAARRVFSTAER